MKIGFKYKYCYGFGKLYGYAYKYSHMITNKAEERLKILEFWWKYGLKATNEAFSVKRSTLYSWQKIYRESGCKLESLNPGSTAPHKKRERITDHRVVNEIRRLRLEVCPNMGKDKVKIFLDQFCQKNNLTTISASTIARIIKDKKIYHHRQKVSHYGKIKSQKKRKKKLRKPKDFYTQEPGDLIEIDTVVRFDWGIKRYIITAIDTKTRYTFALTYTRANSKNVKDFYQKLETIFPYSIKAIQTDNGSEFHKYFRIYLKEQEITHYWNYPGQPYKNGHIEKYNRTIQEEFIDQNSVLLEDTGQFNKKLMSYLIWYNTKRPHWSLNLTSPVDYLINNYNLSNMLWTETSV
jgi:transposase InsO family protein